jgi:hypothetical protein
MRAIVVFLAGVGLVIFGKLTGDNDSQYAGCILFGIGLTAMVGGWMSEIDNKE